MSVRHGIQRIMKDGLSDVKRKPWQTRQKSWLYPEF
jgi:hypothetical protein